MRTSSPGQDRMEPALQEGNRASKDWGGGQQDQVPLGFCLVFVVLFLVWMPGRIITPLI